MAGLITVREAMTKEVKTVREDTPVQEVIAVMNKFDISSVVVVQKDRPLGLITHKDLLTKVLQSKLPATDLTSRAIMSTPLVRINEEASIEEAARLMTSKRLKKLVVTKNDKLVGIITSTDLMKTEPKMVKTLEDLLKTCR